VASRETICGIIANLTYTGVLRCGDARSEVQLGLQIVSPEQYETAQQISKARSHATEKYRTVPLNTRGQSLLAGNVFCGHCGARLTLTTSGKYRRRGDGSMDKTPRIRYVCYGKVRKQTECTGPTGYTMHILDEIIDKIVRRIFQQMQGISKSELINTRYQVELVERKAHLTAVTADYAKAASDLATLKAEVVKSIKGESAFSQEMLAGLISEAEAKVNELATQCKIAEDAVSDSEQLMKELSSQYDEIISWAELYNSASFEAKKMIVNCLISRVEVSRGYAITISFNFNLAQFFEGLDCFACIEEAINNERDEKNSHPFYINFVADKRKSPLQS